MTSLVLVLCFFGGPDFSTGKAEARALLTKGQFKEAVARATALNKQMPDDLDTYALLVDGYRGLGKPEEAEKAADWMLRLRPTDIRSLRAAALLREDFGDLNGAMDMWIECRKRATFAGADTQKEISEHMARLDQKKKEIKK